MASDQEVQAKQERVAKLRAQVEEANTRRASNEAELTNDITIAQLDVEEARLEAQLAEAKASATKTAVKDGANTTLQAAREAQAAAREQAKAAEKAASTTSEKGE